MAEDNSTDELNKPKWRIWLKRSGILVFLFFLVKGLVWIGIAVFVWLGLTK